MEDREPNLFCACGCGQRVLKWSLSHVVGHKNRKTPLDFVAQVVKMKGEGMTLQQIADHFNVTRTRVMQEWQHHNWYKNRSPELIEQMKLLHRPQKEERRPTENEVNQWREAKEWRTAKKAHKQLKSHLNHL